MSLRGLIETIVLKFYGLLGPRFFSPRYFEYRYRLQADPWGYEISPYEQLKYRQTLEILPPKRFERVLEVGCSIGVFTEQLVQSGVAREITGVDVAETALKRARQRLARFNGVKLLLLDITRQELEDSFDLIICAEILYYLGMKNILLVRDKLIGALREGGHLVLVNPWPLACTLHGIFLERPELHKIKEHIERESCRPYAITLFVKKSSG